jgi:hypothetical protein
VNGDVVRLPLDGGDWVEVKAELNAGEMHDLFAETIGEMRPDGARTLDLKKVPFASLLAYIVRWSLLDTQGRPQPFSESALRGVDGDTYREIRVAVDQHIAAVEAKREARKNGQGGAIESPAISPSLVA